MALNIPPERLQMFEETLGPTVEEARNKIKEKIRNMRSTAPVARTTRGQRAQAQLQDEGHMNELLRQIDLRMDEILEALYMQLSKDIDAAVDQKLETAAASSSK